MKKNTYFLKIFRYLKGGFQFPPWTKMWQKCHVFDYMSCQKTSCFKCVLSLDLNYWRHPKSLLLVLLQKRRKEKKTSYISTDITANCCIIVVVWPVYKKCLIFDWKGDTFELLIMMTMTLSKLLGLLARSTF